MATKGDRTRGAVLVIDDHYGVVSDSFYSRDDFEADYGRLPFRFAFSAAWDEAQERHTVEAALRDVENHAPDGVLLDIVFDSHQGDQLGLSILRRLADGFPALPVVMMTVLSRREAWEQSARLGAVDYLPKPLDARLLSLTLDRYVGVEPENWVIGQNHAFLEALNLVAMAAEGGLTPIMIGGETGTGKGLVARFAHRHGRRADAPFEVIDLTNIPADHQAANLFGYRKGAFTGAERDEPGRFLAADGGVVFLDEIGDIDEGTQLRLLRVADTGEVSRLGDGRTTRVDVQLVTATNADLSLKIKTKEFRYDLWARLSGMPVTLPPLAQRRDDIPLLVRHLLRCEAWRRGRKPPELPERLEGRLQGHPWAGNVRGLLNYVQRVFDLSANGGRDDAFEAALAVQGGPWSEADNPLPTTGSASGRGAPGRSACALEDPVQKLRLDELAVLAEALERTRDPLSGRANRAKAAALLKGKAKCSTNEFDRWAAGVWDDLSPEGRELAAERFPEIASSVPQIAKRRG